VYWTNNWREKKAAEQERNENYLNYATASASLVRCLIAEAH